jgi:hypothetical protein
MRLQLRVDQLVGRPPAVLNRWDVEAFPRPQAQVPGEYSGTYYPAECAAESKRLAPLPRGAYDFFGRLRRSWGACLRMAARNRCHPNLLATETRGMESAGLALRMAAPRLLLLAPDQLIDGQAYVRRDLAQESR